jgi:hypothetical protein
VARLVWWSVVEMERSDGVVVRGRLGMGVLGWVSVVWLAWWWRLSEVWVWKDNWLMLSSSVGVVVARMVVKKVERLFVGGLVVVVGVVGSSDRSIGRSEGEWNSRGWSGGRKSNESIGVRPCSRIRLEAAWRLRTMKGSKLSGSKRVRTRGLLVDVPMS